MTPYQGAIYHSWLIVTNGKTFTATYATPVAADQVQHDHPGAVVMPAINFSNQHRHIKRIRLC